MRKPFTCGHAEDPQLRKRTAAGGTAMLGHQCLTCGRLVGNWVKLERVPNWQDLPRWDYELEPKWEQAEKKYMLEYREQRLKAEGVAAFSKPAPVPDQFWAKYNTYLKSPEWREKRERVLKRANGVCEGCGVAAATQVHHLTYTRVGKEMLFDLAAICDACHKVVHEAHA